MRSIRLFVVLAATTALTACLNSTTLIKLKPDGSGTVEQTTLVNFAAVKGLMPGADKQMQGPVMNREDLERTAARMGKGVKLVSAEPAKGANGFEGTKAVFSFEDINQIQVSQDPNMSGSTNSRMSSEPNSDDPVKFKLTRNGSTSTLTIAITDRPIGDEKAPGSEPDPNTPDLTNPMMMNMLKSMFAGFKVNIDLEVIGKIVKTNAEYVNGSRLTLLEMDMESLLADEAKLKALTSKLKPGASLAEVKPYLKDIKGIKVDGPTINVEFR